MKHLRCFFAVLLLAGTSCGKVDEPRHHVEKRGVRVEFSLGIRKPACRSSFCPDELDRITDINVWVYQAGVLLEDYSFYEYVEDGSPLEIVFPSVHSEYDIYLLANMGCTEGPALESDIGDACASLDSYASFREKGFPMAGTVMGFSPSGNGNATLSRLVGRYDIRAYRNPSNTKADYTFLSGKMKSCAAAIRPFASMGDGGGYSSRVLSAGELLSEGDVLSADDIARLNEGRTVTLYYLENCQGLLLPDNDTQYGKSAEAVAEATGDPSRAALCSFLELECRAVTPTATYESVTYRAYLGRDATSDFSVERNSVTSLVLDVASNLIAANGWFVEPGTPEINAHIITTTASPIPLSLASRNGWNYSSCPNCGASWGSASFRFATNAQGAYLPSCTCGWTGSSMSIDESFSGSPLWLYDFLSARIYVTSDLSWGNGFTAYFSSSGTSSGRGFSLQYRQQTTTIGNITVTDLNPTAADSTTGEDVLDTLVIASYDGLIKHEFPIHGVTHAIPLGFNSLGYSSPTAGMKIYFGSQPAMAYGNPAGISFSFSLHDIEMYMEPGVTSATAPDEIFTVKGSHDLPVELPTDYVRVYWGKVDQISSGYTGPYDYLQGCLDITGASVGAPYFFTSSSAKNIKMGFSPSNQLVTTPFSGNRGIFDGKPYGSSSRIYSLNMICTATGYRYESGEETSCNDLWVMLKLRTRQGSGYANIRDACSSERFWTYRE